MEALENIKVLDLTRVLAGPYCTMLLGDLGAEIIKVEIPEVGDDSRAFGPFINGESAYFMSLNRNKRSITLNLKTEEGKEIFKDLVKQVDVLVENFKPGTMEKLGLDYEVLKNLNERLIYAASSGFGQTGPYSKRPAYDGVIQAMSGIMSITGHELPTRVGPSIGDITAGLFTTIGILTALNSRSITGQGQMVDVSMLDCQVAILENAISRYQTTGINPKPIGNRHSSIVPFEAFDTSDATLMIAVGNNNLWQKFCKAINLSKLISDERFSTNENRNINYDDLMIILREKIKEYTKKDLEEILIKAQVPCGPINNIKEVLEDKQVIHRDMIVDVDHIKAGKTSLPGIPIKLSETPASIKTSSPLLGQHTSEILKEYLNYSDKKIKELKDKNVT